LPAARACTAFAGSRLLMAGALIDVAMAVKTATRDSTDPVLVFDDATGRVIDLDLRGSKAEIAARLPAFLGGSTPDAPAAAAISGAVNADKRGRGRPRLGVVPRAAVLRGGVGAAFCRLAQWCTGHAAGSLDRRHRRLRYSFE